MTIRPIRVRWIQRRPEAASRMLDSMAGLITGTQDALTRFVDRLLLFRALRREIAILAVR